MYGKILTVGDDIEINGAGMTEATVQIVGYIIFAFVIIIFAYRALKAFKESNTSKSIKELSCNSRIFSSIIFSNVSI